MAQTDAQILEEISRLSGAINRHKSQAQHAPRGGYRGGRPHGPPAYRKPYAYPSGASGSSHTDAPQEVVLGGQVFQSSRGGKSLVRKGAPTASRPPSRASTQPTPTSTPSAATIPLATPPTQTQQLVHAGKNKLVAANRIGKSKPPPPPPAVLAAKRARLAKLSATLANVQSHRNQRGAFGKSKLPIKRKVVDKPCRFWTRTGICQNGNTCPYQHDPNKTAICPRFVTKDCPNTALTCPLSHDSTPERMPLCVHFQNAGRCRLGSACPYPHVFLGPDNVKTGVCRDFAVLGYCEKGVECPKNHVRECPDFAEHGVCRTKGCKLPHVIRASKGKMAAAAAEADLARVKGEQAETQGEQGEEQKAATGQKLGDEFVSLMFEESEDDDEDDDEEVGDGGEIDGESEHDHEVVTADEDDEAATQGEDDEQDVDQLLSEDTDMM